MARRRPNGDAVTIEVEDRNPFVEIRPGGRYVTGWLMSGTDQDWTAILFRLDDGPFVLAYRFRIYETGQVSAYHVMSKLDQPDAQEIALRKTADRIAANLVGAGFLAHGCSLHRVEIRGDHNECRRRWLEPYFESMEVALS